MKSMFIIFVLAFYCMSVNAAWVKLDGLSFEVDDSYVDAGFTIFTNPRTTVNGVSYELAQSSDFDRFCQHLGFNSGQSEIYETRSIVPAGFKAIVDSRGYVDLIDETEGCFLFFCLISKPILLPARKVFCK